MRLTQYKLYYPLNVYIQTKTTDHARLGEYACSFPNNMLRTHDYIINITVSEVSKEIDVRWPIRDQRKLEVVPGCTHQVISDENACDVDKWQGE